MAEITPESLVPEVAVEVHVDDDAVTILARCGETEMTVGFPNDGIDHNDEIRFLVAFAPQIIQAALDQLEAS